MGGVSWNRYYLAYCAANGNSPEAQLAADRARFRTGHMLGFMKWIQGRWDAFYRERDITQRVAAVHEQAFLDWLGEGS